MPKTLFAPFSLALEVFQSSSRMWNDSILSGSQLTIPSMNEESLEEQYWWVKAARCNDRCNFVWREHCDIPAIRGAKFVDFLGGDLSITQHPYPNLDKAFIR